MANELTYQSVFTGQEMDERFAAVAQLQAALLEVETALSAKYVKPASGIPETDLDSAVQSALAKARSAVQDLSNYYTKTEIDSLLAAVNSQEYVDVATLPTASASTLGKIYLVGPTDNQYDRYYTSYDGSDYSWVAAGSTEINLSNYATKAELNQLGQKVDGLETTVYESPETVDTTNDNYTPTSYASQPYEDPRQVLPVGAQLLGVMLKSTGTANTNRSQLRIYDSTRTLVKTYTLDFIGTTDTYMDVSAENIIIQEGYHYAVYRCGYKWVSGLNVFVRADTGNVESGSFFGITFRYKIAKPSWNTPIEELHSEVEQVAKNLPYLDQSNYWSGKGSTFSDNTYFTGLIPGRKYRIRPHVTSWPTTSAPSGGTIFAIGTASGKSSVTNLVVVYKGGTIKPYYDFVLPTECDGFFCSGRADADYKFWVSIYDITGDLWADDVIRATNAAAIKDKASYTMEFVAGVEHSSTSDQLLIRIPQGMTFVLHFVPGTAVLSPGTVVPRVYYADGTFEDFRSVTPGNNYVFTASKEIIAIGVYKKASDIETSGDLTIEIWDNDGRYGLSIFAVNELNEVSEKLQQVYVGSNGVTLLHFSDIHGEQDNLSRIVQFGEHFKKYLNDVVCTGDFVYNVFGDSFAFWDAAGAQSVLPAIGNHDVWIDGAGDSSATIQQCYDKYIKDNIGNWGVQSPGEVCYFYKDYNNGESYPVRLIVLDCMHIDATQTSWVESILSDARTNGITVLIAAHYTPSVMADMTINRDSTFTAFAAPNTSTGYDSLQPIEDIVETFITNGGKFACWIAGHYHADVFGLSEHGQPVIVIDKSCLALPTNNFSRKGGTKTQDLFNVLSIDAKNSIIRICRIGCDLDKMMRPVVTLSYNFATKTAIYNC